MGESLGGKNGENEAPGRWRGQGALPIRAAERSRAEMAAQDLPSTSLKVDTPPLPDVEGVEPPWHGSAHVRG